MRKLAGAALSINVAAALLAGCGTLPLGSSSSAAQSIAPPSDTPGWIHAGNVVYHVPAYLAVRPSARRASQSSGLQYYGGPVLLKPKVYLIFWGYKKYGDPHKVASLLTEYVKVMGGSGHNNIYTQYYDVVNSQKQYIANERAQLGGVWFDETNPVPDQPTDYQVAVEAVSGVSHFGYDANGSYVVATPHGHDSSGFGTQWCAYHSATTSGGNLVSYTNLPYIPDARENCRGNGLPHHPKDESRADQAVTVIEGAEEGDSVTDPDPGNGWYDIEYGEIDSCPGGQHFKNDRFRNRSYTMGAMYSNASESCVQSYK